MFKSSRFSYDTKVVQYSKFYGGLMSPEIALAMPLPNLFKSNPVTHLLL